MLSKVFSCFVLLLISTNGKVISEQNMYSNEEGEEMLLGKELLGALGISPPAKKLHRLSFSDSALQFLMEVYDDVKDDARTLSTDKSFRSARSSRNLVTDEDVMDIEECNNVMTFLTKGNEGKGNITELSFQILEVPRELTLHKAELKIFKDFPSKRQYESDIFEITVFLKSDNGYSEQFVIDQINVTSTYRGWLEVNVTKVLLKWLNERKDNLVLYIKVNILGGSNLSTKDAGFIGTSTGKLNKPFMVGCFNGPDIIPPNENSRSKRSIRYSSLAQRFQIPKVCQRMNFTVNFDQLGWTWIIAPEKFEAYFCSGECDFPLGPSVSPSNHAIVQTLMHLRHPNIPRPQCAPTKLTSISVVYYLNEYIVNHKIFRQIVAESCGCQ